MSQTPSSTADPSIHPVLGIPLERMPRHVAIIMDGNGRWAQERGLPRIEGHRNGSRGVRDVIESGSLLGLECLTLYSFSTENWKRPQLEIDALMGLYQHYLIAERPTIMNNNVRVRHLGRREGLPAGVLEALDETIEMSAGNSGMWLCLALNYSGRLEISLAVQQMCQDVRDSKLSPEAVDEALIGERLYTHGLPDPDLLIRTSGEMRISNFLLWQISYAELYVTDVHWPDFDSSVLGEAIRTYAGRNRRFGGLNKPR